MSKFKCRCDFEFIDNCDDYPYSAMVLPERWFDDYWNSVAKLMAEYIEAAISRSTDQWIRNHAPHLAGFDIKHEGMINDFIDQMIAKRSSYLYECPRCRRLWLNSVKHRESRYPYMPEFPEQSKGDTILGSDEP